MKVPSDLTVILIAEDSPTQSENLRYLLERHGYKVIAAKNGREAVDMIDKHQPQLLISDIIMPEMDGYELCRCIRTDLGLRDLPIIFLTVLSDPADIMKSLECGADSFIIKPFQEGPLLERIRLLLASQSLRQRQERQEPVEVDFHGKKYQINADRLQIMNLLVSTYEAAVEQNQQLIQTQRDLRTQAQILTEINRIFHEAITCETEEELGRTCLAAAEELTDSKFGFISEKNQEGLLDDIAVSDPGWEACRLPGTNKPAIPKGFHIRGIFGRTIKEEKSIIVNDPASDPDRVGTPAGHPPIEAFLGVPLKQAGETIGMIGLGNKPGGYDLGDQTAAEALAPAIVESFLRKRAETRIKELNAALALHVRQLEAANQELESFSYSVAHDLRAPLRGISGFSRILQEEYHDKLDAEGNRLLQNIQTDVKKMGDLIDDLLALSRLARRELKPRVFEMEPVVQFISQELQEREPGRKVEIHIEALPPVRGDLDLIREALWHLLANACKFTRTRAVAVIDISGWAAEKENVYCVQDNGVGFDMEYAGKLFEPFQRLHLDGEYEGTGMGLAIVRRIIQRHHGRVWAEGKAGEGAKFCFSLPKPG